MLGQPLTYRIGTPGRHIALNSLGVLAAVRRRSAPTSRWRRSRFADLKPPVGRGERTVLDLGGGEALLIDESYNANPASMRAALATLGAVELGRGGRRIAVLGDMLELGPEGRALHRDLAGRDRGERGRPRLRRRPADAEPRRSAAARADRRLMRRRAAELATRCAPPSGRATR